MKPALVRMSDAHVVLVGGQALNFWAELYRGRVVELAAAAPFTSKDIDFCGDRRAVIDCAKRLNGQFFLPDNFDPTPNSGRVIFEDAAGSAVEIDFIREPHGLSAEDVRKTSLRVELLDDDGNPIGVSFHVLHPERCMESRVYNYVGLNIRSSLALKQLQASVYCAREFSRELLRRGLVRPVLKLNERIFRFCCLNFSGRQVHRLSGVDPFMAVVSSQELPEKFNEIRYPQMCQLLKQRRSKGPRLQDASVLATSLMTETRES